MIGRRCRSLLPYDLVFVTHEGTRDPLNRALEARLTGDLEGFSHWIIRPATAGTGADLLFEEEVVTNKALLWRLAPIARAAFRDNHALMMRHGRSPNRADLGHGRPSPRHGGTGGLGEERGCIHPAVEVDDRPRAATRTPPGCWTNTCPGDWTSEHSPKPTSTPSPNGIQDTITAASRGVALTA
jgi:hypothetical protein